jgi:type II secretory pathway pseudopilin PulG
MLRRVIKLRARKLTKHQLGASLIEVVIAIVVLGLVVASVPVAIMAVHNFQARQRELRYAENLARSEFEYIKSQPYIPAILGNTTEFEPNPLFNRFPSPYLDQTVMKAEEPQLGGTYFVNNYVYFVNPTTNEKFLATPQSIGNESGIQEILIRIWGVRGTDYVYIYELSDYKTATGAESQ